MYRLSTDVLDPGASFDRAALARVRGSDRIYRDTLGVTHARVVVDEP